jgi:TRAP-type C4-dicarboxylate transport system permease small subunit
MTHIRRIIDKLLEFAVAGVMAVLVVDVLWQVFTRFILRDPSSWTEELARYLLIWVGLLGAAYAAGRRMHLAVDLLPTKLTGKKRLQLEIFIEIATLAFAFFALVIGGFRLVMVTLVLNQTSAALQLPLGYVYVVVPLSGVLIMFYSLDHIRTLLGEDHTESEGAHGVA